MGRWHDQRGEDRRTSLRSETVKSIERHVTTSFLLLLNITWTKVPKLEKTIEMLSTLPEYVRRSHSELPVGVALCGYATSSAELALQKILQKHRAGHRMPRSDFSGSVSYRFATGMLQVPDDCLQQMAVKE